MKGSLRVTLKTSFDKRVVRYEEIHSIQQNDFDAMVASAELSGDCRVLDCGCGYGAVSRELIKDTEQVRRSGTLKLSIDLLDESDVQLDRARQELAPQMEEIGTQLGFIRGSFPHATEDLYDVIICKMVLHEIRREEQMNFVNGVYDRLKKTGRFILWDLCLASDIAEFHRSVVKMKDMLVGYDTMVERRYFLSENELVELFKGSSFGGIEFVKRILYRFETHKRLNPEFGGDKVAFYRWEEYIRTLATAASPELLKRIEYEDRGDNICFNVGKVLAKARR
jgi:SAM-dependent methyltransferase